MKQMNDRDIQNRIDSTVYCKMYSVIPQTFRVYARIIPAFFSGLRLVMGIYLFYEMEVSDETTIRS